MAKGDNLKKVRDFFMGHLDEDVTVEQVANATGLTMQQATSAIYTARNRTQNPLPIVQVRARVFRLDSIRAPEVKEDTAAQNVAEPECFEVVGRTKRGFMVRGDDGNLYIVEPLDL